MGTPLTGQTKASTYDSLLKITDNGPVGGTEKVVTDGLGNDSALTIGASGVSSTGTLSVAGVATLASAVLSAPLPVASGGTAATTAAAARTSLGLGDMATQTSDSVSITGGSISGITDLAVSDGGTGASTAANARTNLGLGTAATFASTAFDTAGAAVSAQAAAIAASCQRASNLSDVANGLTSLSNLGLTNIKSSVDGSQEGYAFYSSGGPFRTSRTSTGVADHVVFYNPNGNVGAVFTSGGTTSYSSASDVRLKENIRDLPSNGLIDSIRPRIFDWKSGSKDQVGFIAQELHAVFPDAVTMGDSGEQISQRWMVDASKMIPILVAEIKSLRLRVAALENS